jgi:hypothetical protein
MTPNRFLTCEIVVFWIVNSKVLKSTIPRTQHWKLLKLSQSLCHDIFLLPREGKSLTRKWRDARASLASK